jgi:alpha-galactosidase
LKPSGEEGVQQIEALLGLRSLTTNINLPNRGQMPGFSTQAVVETYAEFGRDFIRPLLAAPLPEGPARLVDRAVGEQLLTLEAGFTSDLQYAFQAILSHPLVSIPTDKAWNMFQEMLEAADPFGSHCPHVRL